jgi:hypothetical protein
MSGMLFTFPTTGPLFYQGVDQLTTNLGKKVTIGDGGLFSTPPQSSSNADPSFEYGSSQNIRSVIYSPAGLYYVSMNQGKIFAYGEGLKEISQNGLKWWFNLFLPYKLTEDFPEYPWVDNPVAGIGCQTLYDNENSVIYFCKKDYTGHITIEHFNEKNAYQYDFRKTDVIVTPRTKEEVDFIFDCVNKKDHYNILGVGSIFKTVKGNLRTTSDNEYAYPVIDKLKKTLANCKLKFTNQFFDIDIGEHRVVTSYLSAGWGKGDKHVGNLVYIPPGYQLSGTYKYIVVKNKKEAEAVAFYLNSKFSRYLMHYWRTSRTCDQPQWNSIPVLDKFDLDTEEKIVEHFVKDKSLQQKILNDKLHN